MILVCKIKVYKKLQKVQHIFSETSGISLNFGIGHKLPQNTPPTSSSSTIIKETKVGIKTHTQDNSWSRISTGKNDDTTKSKIFRILEPKLKNLGSRAPLSCQDSCTILETTSPYQVLSLPNFVFYGFELLSKNFSFDNIWKVLVGHTVFLETWRYFWKKSGNRAYAGQIIASTVKAKFDFEKIVLRTLH